MGQRRLSLIISFVESPQNLAPPSGIPAWLSSLGPDGKWPDSEVDYTTGCDAQRANWPAYFHWNRILTIAAAWHGGLEGEDQYVKDPAVQSAISNAMDWWFERDFTNIACLDNGGTASCPCGTPGLWNTNWYSNVILIPMYMGQACLLMNDTLTATQLSNCTHISTRGYSPFYRNPQPGYVSGANILDMSKIGVDSALLTGNASLLSDAYSRVHAEVVIEQAVKADGIRPDGSFGQHGGLLYNGNYGKDFSNDVLALEITAGGTQFAANSTTKNAFATLIDGDQWMIYRNVLTGVLHWDFSTLPRFISFPVVDAQATAQINLNLSQIGQLGEEWNSTSLINVDDSLSKNTTTANAGTLIGNRMFYDNDYMVHRGAGYVTTLKMYSTRTENTECTNSQNPLGFHLSDGTTYTYLSGDEYEDIAAAWDWNLIPGITVDYAATPLACSTAGWKGTQPFVGGVSDGLIGASAMRFTNPDTKSLSWQKAWFFLDDDVQHVMVANIHSTTNSSIFSVLDQKKHSGTIFINGFPMFQSNYSRPLSLWHDNVGYAFDNSTSFTLSVEVGEKTGNWSNIGTSTQPPVTVDLFAAWLDHKDLTVPLSYSVYPATNLVTFEKKALLGGVRVIENNAHTSAIVDDRHDTAMAIFWDVAGGNVTFTSPFPWVAPVTVQASGNAAIIYRMDTGNITVSDPSQSLRTVDLTFSIGEGRAPARWPGGRSRTLSFSLPTGGLAGNSVSQTLH
ncbi:polysaccharide lyase family 8 protein [Punctularia strigosozonata HHB-11173 SS5]|uniref:polysaccharide lyase family 8 protein n=1 Tax=Punctularia strigosozonata (strain HHB-11173) TaxID=741275 RepID=UPI0004416FBA|nr:polysaccharide lyase family 8 protein [Punctularia strigosozonata HHB-11173 SS5]EIN13720.1 polysaccharide lyase family 8 protein [Punctularia strigosozonata HHB-11173 SS5]